MKDDAIAQLSDQLTYGFDNKNAGTWDETADVIK